MGLPGMMKPVSIMALIGLLSACGVALTSMITSYWIILVDNSHIGLFYHCNQTDCVPVNFTFNNTSSKGKQPHFKAIRGLIITGLILGLCGFLTALGFVVDAMRSKGVHSLALLRSSLVLNPLGGFVIILAAAIFSSTIYIDPRAAGANLGFSYGLCLTAGCSMICFEILVFLGGPRKLTAPTMSRIHSRSGSTRTASAILPVTSVIMASLQPPPHYSPPTEQYMVAQYSPPPDYFDYKTPPPSYDDDALPPPSYEDEFSMEIEVL